VVSRWTNAFIRVHFLVKKRERGEGIKPLYNIVQYISEFIRQVSTVHSIITPGIPFLNDSVIALEISFLKL